MDPQLKARWGARNAKILIDPFLSGNRDNGWSGYPFRGFEHDGWWPLGPATEIGSLLTVKRSGSMEMKTLLSPASSRNPLRQFDSTRGA
jgi:hypothetical protein